MTYFSYPLVYRECMYVFGGINEGQPLNDLHEYNFGTSFLYYTVWGLVI